MFWSWGIVLVTTTASNMELLMRDTAGPEKMPWVQMAYTFTAPASNNLHEGKHRYTTEWRKNTSPTKRWQIQVSFTMVRSPYLKWFTTRKCVLHSSYRQQNNCPKRFTLKHDQGNRQKLQQGWCTCSWHGNTVNNLIRYTGRNGTKSKHWVKLLSKQRSTTGSIISLDVYSEPKSVTLIWMHKGQQRLSQVITSITDQTASKHLHLTILSISVTATQRLNSTKSEFNEVKQFHFCNNNNGNL